MGEPKRVSRHSYSQSVGAAAEQTDSAAQLLPRRVTQMQRVRAVAGARRQSRVAGLAWV